MPTPWPRAGAGDTRSKTHSMTNAAATLLSRLYLLASADPTLVSLTPPPASRCFSLSPTTSAYLAEAARAGMPASSPILSRTAAVSIRTSSGV